MEITIDIAEYFDLVKAQAKLCALEGAGVDNWSGYDYIWEDEDFYKLSEQTLEEFTEEFL